jgi:hypothetical protein
MHQPASLDVGARPSPRPAGGIVDWLSRHRWPMLVAALLLAICVAPVVMAGIDGAGRTWHPAGDWSVLELRTRDVGSSATPLLGPYSRFGWNHPGPMLFWLFAVPYRLLGQSSSTMLLASALANAGAIVGVGVFAWRRGRLPLVAGAATGLAILCTHLGPSFLRDPWNPSITALPFALFVLLAWSAWEGDRLAVPLLAFTGSLLVQSHIGFAGLVIVLWAIAAMGFCRRDRAWRRPILWSVVVLGVCWLPVVADQFVGTGNLGELGQYFRGGSSEGPAGWGTALGVVAREMGGVAPWLGGVERGSSWDGGLVIASASSLVVPLLAFGVAAFVAFRRRAASALRFQAIVAVATGVGFVSAARVTGPVFAYLVRWMWVLGLLWWLSTFWALWSALFATSSLDAPPARRWTVVRSWATVGLTVLALVVVTRTSVRTASGIDRIGTPDGEWYVTLDVIADDVVAATPRTGPVLVQAAGSNNGSIADAIRLQLDRHGIPVVVDDDQRNKYGESRLASAHPPTAVMTVATGATLTGPFGATFGTPIAAWDPLTPDERQFANDLEEQLADQFSLVGRNDLVTALRSGGSLAGAHDLEGVNQDVLQTVERYRRQGDPVTVYIDPSIRP